MNDKIKEALDEIAWEAAQCGYKLIIDKYHLIALPWYGKAYDEGVLASTIGQIDFVQSIELAAKHPQQRNEWELILKFEKTHTFRMFSYPRTDGPPYDHQ